MIHARLTQDSDGNFVACSLRGHADYDEKGHDIVCAAVSILSINCANSLEGVLEIEPLVTGNSDGLLSFSLPQGLSKETMGSCQILMKSLQIGLQTIAQEYPHNLKLSISNGGKYDDQT